MSPAPAAIAPRYVRLSGEIADQAVLDSLQGRLPGRRHRPRLRLDRGRRRLRGDRRPAKAFPPASSAAPGDGARCRSSTARCAALARAPPAAISARRRRAASTPTASSTPATWSSCGASRYHFVGRRGGVINVGGLKVHPEEVEAVINRHPAVAHVAGRAGRKPDHRRDRRRRGGAGRTGADDGAGGAEAGHPRALPRGAAAATRSPAVAPLRRRRWP